MSYVHEMTWAYIYKSQFLMLLELNRRNARIPLSDAKAYYDKAVPTCPKMYAKYSFDGWLQFLVTHQVIIRHPPPHDEVEMTHRGKDFLKYITHCGYTADGKAC